MKRRLGALMLALSLMLVLTGCLFQSPESLYRLPKLPKEYSNLQDKLTQLLATGLTYASPVTGSNTQSIQLQDLNGDGVDEAVVFLRDTSSTAEKPLKIYIFQQNEEEEYETAYIIESEGTAIQWIMYEQLNDTTMRELVISWQLATNLYNVSVYALESSAPKELLRKSYTSCVVRDMDRDNRKEIMLLQVNEDEAEGNYVELYKTEGSDVYLAGSAALSVEMAIGRGTSAALKYGYLRNEYPVLFVNGPYSEGDNMRIADLFAVRDGMFTNITLNPETGNSDKTIHNYSLGVQDINGDSITELPMREPVRLSPESEEGMADLQYVVKWYQYDLEGEAYYVYTTYHNDKDGWYLILPEEWNDVVTISRRDTAYGERIITFSHWDETTETAESFLSIYNITGENRASRAELGNRVVLLDENDTIYAAEFLDCGWDCGLTMDELSLERFRLITTEWGSSDS